MVLVYVICAVYIIAVNFYSVMLLKTQRDEYSDGDKKGAGDGKLILAAILGGALSIYISMFIMRYRLNNLLFMILMPVIAVINIYFFYVALRSGFPMIFLR